MLSAITLMTTPVLGHADGEKSEDSGLTFELVQQVKEKTPITMEEYKLGVQNAYVYLSQFIKYDNMQADLQCLYYLINRSYMPKDIEDELISNGIVFETHLYDQMESFMRAMNLINVINDSNQSTVRKNDINLLIDLSKLCFADADINLVHDIHTNYFNAYQNGRFYNESFEDNEAYKMLFKQLTTLNAAEQAGNASELSVGARWVVYNSYVISTMEMLATDMQEEHSIGELSKYFDRLELNQDQFIVIEDADFHPGRCVEKPDLEAEAGDYYTLWHYGIDTAHNDMFKTFEVVCEKTK